MKIGVLTSSRADYSIYYPLVKKLSDDSFFECHIIAFGTHLSKKYGYTVDAIKADGFKIAHLVDTMPDNDSPVAIAESMGKTIRNFSSVWSLERYDLILCLGDRYEMFAAVSSTIPFDLKVAHISGGETTLGAIDNKFRHCLTLMSDLHFTSTEVYKNKVVEITGDDSGVYNVGALSFDNLKSLKLYSQAEFLEKYSLDLNIPTVLITFHPETVSFEKNELYIKELIEALRSLNGYQYLITMPNADTMGEVIRNEISAFIDSDHRAKGFESLGTIGYLSAMAYCSFLLGNTSSGFVEAAYFPKYVINLGDRQKGRLITSNIKSVPINKDAILSAVKEIQKSSELKRSGIYGEGNTAEKIVSILKNL